METLLLTLSPIAVAAVAQIVKLILTYGAGMVEHGGIRLAFLRVLVAVLSFGSVIGSAILSGQEVDVASIQTFGEAILVFLGASGAYFLAKKK